MTRLLLLSYSTIILCLGIPSLTGAFRAAIPPFLHNDNAAITAAAAATTTTTTKLKAANSAEEEGIGVGIDLGTTHSAIAILNEQTGLPNIISIPNNGRTMPSVVTLVPHDDDDDEVLVGKEAIDREADMGSYRNVKRILGRGVTVAQESMEVVPFLSIAHQQHQEHSPHAMVDDDYDDGTNKKKGGKSKKKKKKKSKKSKKKNSVENLTQQIKEAEENPALLLKPHSSSSTTTAIMPAEISAHILRKLISTVEEETKQTVTRAVIGIPAYFHDAQRDATIQAAKLAGLGDKVKLLREPEAAALAYGVGKQQLSSSFDPYGEDEDADEDELVLVFDLGGGTYDVSMLLVGGGLTEIITTSGNSQLGGSDFDAKVAQHLKKVMSEFGFFVRSKPEEETCLATDAIVRSAEMIRIYLSNNRSVKLALPLNEDSWSHMPHAKDVILPLDFEIPDGGNEKMVPWTTAGVSNTTHLLCQLTRKELEKMCQEEFLALLRPIREVAIMAGALLPGDTSPTIVQAAMEMEEYDNMVFEDFYKEDDDDDDDGQASAANINDTTNAGNEDGVDDTILAQLQDGLDEISMKERKKAQQRGRKKARDVTKRERKFRQEKRKLAEQAPIEVDSSENVKVRDGISGRPISRIVLVGGATRMPGIGRLLAALTGVVPQRTVNPDEAVALGCAVHVGVLDGKEDLGTVLNPMQAAILRAVAEQQHKEGLLSADFDEEEDFEEVEFF